MAKVRTTAGKAANLILVLAGAFPAFLLIGPVVFADGPPSERYATLALALLVYFALGAATGYLTRKVPPALWLGAPAAVVALVLMDQAALSLAVTGGVLVVTALGALMGAGRRTVGGHRR